MENQLMQGGLQSETDFPASSELEMYISRGTYMDGIFKIRGKALINGFVEGEIYCDNFVEIGKDAEIKGKITNCPL